ncbi:hypothetical protein [Corynebacterium uterequi]|uniref:Uncharacterized protein n=1 Tax=Corynebacterium uterequi TaxID=1072256 RepID=A0A0G3HCN9_9CORY|nr:hypothetical protein [Corynebacterium uterequi]AKK10480.1 hypothetical protein CUTER_02325 [Corynebacterium uterequi]
MRTAIAAVLGVIVLALGVWWLGVAGPTVAGILAALVIAAGGALLCTALGMGLDDFSKTHKKI